MSPSIDSLGSITQHMVAVIGLFVEACVMCILFTLIAATLDFKFLGNNSCCWPYDVLQLTSKHSFYCACLLPDAAPCTMSCVLLCSRLLLLLLLLL